MRVTDLNGRISDLQRSLNDTADEKKRLDDRLSTMERVSARSVAEMGKVRGPGGIWSESSVNRFYPV